MHYTAINNPEYKHTRPAVNAGRFYPAHTKELRETLKQCFQAARKKISTAHVYAIISPHAGYVYSGEVAASAFNQIGEQEVERVFILAPSHYTKLNGASIYYRGNYETPLGEVKVDSELAKKLIDYHDFLDFQMDAHLEEHSLEVQLPFLKYLRKDAVIVPFLIGTQDNKILGKIADALTPYFHSKNLFIISTDFSHFPDYEHAQLIDGLTAEAVLRADPDVLMNTLDEIASRNIPHLATSMCGLGPVLVLLHLVSERKKYKMNHIQYRNSGDVDFADKSRVVGYHAFSVTKLT